MSLQTARSDTYCLMPIKLALREHLSSLLKSTGVLPWCATHLAPSWTILMYHRVLGAERERTEIEATIEPAIEAGMYVREETFRKHCEYLKTQCHVVPLEKLITDIQSKKDIPPKTIAITFDDGWQDNFSCAFPILSEFSLPATIFLPTSFIGTKKTSLEDQQEPKMPPGEGLRRSFLSWEEVLTMAKSGISFGSHTHTHRTLPSLTLPEIQEEITKSLQTIQERGGISPSSVFCYPKGAFNDETQRALQSCGILAALTTSKNTPQKTSPLLLPRVGIHEDVTKTIPMFESRVWMKKT